MKSFQVLDRSQHIQKNYLLEASAGTGKTFSIENIVVRLLIENEPFLLEQILVVTFTRAATRDLKSRIHNNIITIMGCLKNPYSKSCPDYLLKIIEEGEESIKMALRNLERAISSFDLAQIYTIHAFCSQMLSDNSFECNFNMSLSESVESANPGKLNNVIRDYFRIGNISKHFSEAEINILLKDFSGNIDSLQKSLLDAASKGMEIEEQPDFNQLLKLFNETMTILKTQHHFESEKIIQDFYTLAPNYKNLADRQSNIKPEIIEAVEGFAKLFEKDSWKAEDLNWLIEDQLSLLKFLDPTNLKVKSKENLVLNHPFLLEIIKQHLPQFIQVNEIFSRMASHCQKVLQRYKEKEECIGFDDFLKFMKDALDNPHFFSKVSNRYKAAIIDEFQDTDPLQWEIFERLFLNDSPAKPLLYLVGDPKQSIYAFRQADIYTYLKAAEKIGIENHYSLDTNYRSHAPLINTLNVLLSEESTPGLLYLPKTQSQMIYPKVKSSPNNVPKLFNDEKGAVHFFIAEDSKKRSLEKLEADFYHPFITQEILKLVEEEHFQLNQIAILIADRYQATRMADFLKQWNVPASLQKTGKLTESVAFSCMRELLSAVIHPKDESALKIALGGKAIRWNHLDMIKLQNPEILTDILQKFYSLRENLLLNGFASFFQQFQKMVWKDSHSVIESLLHEERGALFLQDLQQVADLLIEQECNSKSGPEFLIKFLDELQSNPEANEELVVKINDPTLNAVQIMTMHASKGLEFEVVFALGLIKRTTPMNSMIPVELNGKRYLRSVTDGSEEYLRHCEELDAEKIRQLYVAMTRAKYRLYNPILFAPLNKKIKVGSASPMDLFLARFGQKPTKLSQIYERIDTYDVDTFKSYAETLARETSLTYSVLIEEVNPLQHYKSDDFLVIHKPPNVIVPGVQRFIQSFTTLSASSLKTYKKQNLDPPHDYAITEKTPHNLPAGSITGNLLHKCLEILSFENCKAMQELSELVNFLKHYLSGTAFEEWKHVICEIVFDAVKTPFFDGFALCDVSSEKCSKESEFLYESRYNLPQGHIKGFIDLFFYHNDRYYLLDWKSNWLGPDETFYTPSHLQIAMEENDYLLQARLYIEALRKYLKLVDSRPFEEIFGGIYYVFLRSNKIWSGKVL